MGVRPVAPGVSVAFEGLGTLAMGTGPLAGFRSQREKPVVIQREKVGEFGLHGVESSAGIKPASPDSALGGIGGSYQSQ